MAATGVKIEDSIIPQFNDFKLKKSSSRFIIYKIEGDKIVTDVVGTNSATFSDFLQAMPPNDGRYAVYDYDFETKDGRPGNKLVFISWVPDVAPVKKKMLYAGSKDALSGALIGIMVKVQATDFSELTESKFLEQSTKFN